MNEYTNKPIRITTMFAVALAVFCVAATAGATSSGGVDGVYRTSWAEKSVSDSQTRHAYANCPGRCLLTLTLRDGSLSLHVPGQVYLADCLGSYAVSRSTIAIEFGPSGCQGGLTAHWTLRNGQLRLRVTRATNPALRAIFGSKPWTNTAPASPWDGTASATRQERRQR